MRCLFMMEMKMLIWNVCNRNVPFGEGTTAQRQSSISPPG